MNSSIGRGPRASTASRTNARTGPRSQGGSELVRRDTVGGADPAAARACGRTGGRVGRAARRRRRAPGPAAAAAAASGVGHRTAPSPVARPLPRGARPSGPGRSPRRTRRSRRSAAPPRRTPGRRARRCRSAGTRPSASRSSSTPSSRMRGEQLGRRREPGVEVVVVVVRDRRPAAPRPPGRRARWPGRRRWRTPRAAGRAHPAATRCRGAAPTRSGRAGRCRAGSATARLRTSPNGAAISEACWVCRPSTER